MTERRASDWPGLFFAVGFIVLGAAALYYTDDMSTLGAVFPRAIATLMVLFSVAYVVVALWRPPSTPSLRDRGSIARRLLLVTVLIAWALFLEKTGFLATSTAAFLLLLFIGNYHPWTPLRAVVYLLASAAILFGLYAIFRFGLQVPLPTGILA